MTNPFKSAQPQSDRIIAPQGNSDEDRAARVRFWLERGNSMLIAEGRGHLMWAHNAGHYFITARVDEQRARLAA